MTVNIGIPKEIQAIIDKPDCYIGAEDIAKVLKIASMTIREQARAGMLDFPCMITGARVRFPKAPFLEWLGYTVEHNKEAV